MLGLVHYVIWGSSLFCGIVLCQAGGLWTGMAVSSYKTHTPFLTGLARTLLHYRLPLLAYAYCH